jgi:hypothetical protein
VQIQDDVTVVGRTQVHDLPHQVAIRSATVVLLRRLAKPAVLRQRQTDDVGVPVVNGSVDGVENAPLAIARPLQAGRIDAAQPDPLAVVVHNFSPHHFERLRPVYAARGLQGGAPRQCDKRSNQKRSAAHILARTDEPPAPTFEELGENDECPIPNDE